MDVLVTPTAGTIYRIDAVEADPIRLNSNLGYYTNFVNLLDLAAVAVPAGFRADGLPFGVTLVGRAGTDAQLLALADRLHRAADVPLGRFIGCHPAAPAVRCRRPHQGAGIADRPQCPRKFFRFGCHIAVSRLRQPCHAPRLRGPGAAAGPSTAAAPGTVAAPDAAAAPGTAEDRISVAVCGAHMEGLPLNQQLTSRNATLVSRTRTAPKYKFYALPGGPPHRPGLVRVATGGACRRSRSLVGPSIPFRFLRRRYSSSSRHRPGRVGNRRAGARLPMRVLRYGRRYRHHSPRQLAPLSDLIAPSPGAAPQIGRRVNVWDMRPLGSKRGVLPRVLGNTDVAQQWFCERIRRNSWAAAIQALE